MGIRFITGFLLIAALAPSQASRPVGAILDDDLAAKLPRMRVLMKECLDREKPSGREVATIVALPKKSIFRGSYDRHSNIAAHWALLSWARRASDAAEVRALLGRFPVEALRAERDFIEASHAASEVRPYADAWLLLLFREIDRTSDDQEVLALARKLAADAETRLLEFIEGCPAPEPADVESGPATRPFRYSSRTRWASGAYDSPLWAVLALQVAPTADPGRRKRFERLRADRVTTARALARRAGRSADFLWVDAMLWASDALASGAGSRPADYAVPPYVPPRKEITLGNCHSLGREIVKLWPPAMKAADGDREARTLFNERLRLCLEREDAWDGPFVTVSHWVPQFVYFAVWLAEGRP